MGLPLPSFMALCRPGNSNWICPTELSKSFTGCNPHNMIITVNNINGDHARIIFPVEYFFSTFIVGAGSFGKRQVFFGFHNFRNMVRQRIEVTPAITSGSAGPRKFEVNHCMNANEIPDTNIAGSTSFAFLNPVISTTR